MGLHVDGLWRLPGGKVDIVDLVEDGRTSTIYRAALRELHEETGLVPKRLKPFQYDHVCYGDDGARYVGNNYIAIFDERVPKVINGEPHKFKVWGWFEFDQLPQLNPHDVEALRLYVESRRT